MTQSRTVTARVLLMMDSDACVRPARMLATRILCAVP
jgi:hypothetical protein